MNRGIEWTRGLLALLLVGCGAPSTVTSSPPDASADVPPEVCGRNVGDLLCDLDVAGYVRDGVDTGVATSVPHETVRLSAVLAKGTAPYAYVYTGSFW